VTLFAHSLGTSNTLAALAYATNAQDYIAQAVLQEPCPIPDVFYVVGPFAQQTRFDAIAKYATMEAAGIHSLWGTQWEA